MPDYDQKNIPTLDDIIEEDVAENTDIDETAPDNPTEKENSPDLFSEESIDDTTEDPVGTETELPDEGVDDEGVDDQDYGYGEQHVEAEQHNGQRYEEQQCEEQRHEEQNYPQVIQTSAQITYQEIYDKSVNPSPDVLTDTDDPGTSSHIDEPLAESAQPPIDPIELDEVVGGVVKQLLPDLEQQLRFLIQRALEEKLPDEIIKPTDIATSIGSDIDLDTENT